MYHLLRNTTIVYGGFEEDSRFHVEHILDVVWSGRGRVLVLFPVNRPGHLHLLSRGARGGRGGGGWGRGGGGGVLTLEELDLSSTGDTERLREAQEQESKGTGRKERTCRQSHCHNNMQKKINRLGKRERKKKAK